ncbi:hypothetical protein BT69DRAFT_797214 [Atractiella rhizophila]|nr:hypothetical protein BT69DRAFT_797214 [Atractiella rhizophila]
MGDWDLNARSVRFKYICSYHSSIGMTPYRARFGRDPFIPQPPRLSTASPALHLDELSNLQRWQDHLTRTQQLAVERNQKSQRKVRREDKCIRRRVDERVFEIGDKVDVREGTGKKAMEYGFDTLQEYTPSSVLHATVSSLSTRRCLALDERINSNLVIPPFAVPPLRLPLSFHLSRSLSTLLLTGILEHCDRSWRSGMSRRKKRSWR